MNERGSADREPARLCQPGRRPWQASALGGVRPGAPCGGRDQARCSTQQLTAQPCSIAVARSGTLIPDTTRFSRKMSRRCCKSRRCGGGPGDVGCSRCRAATSKVFGDASVVAYRSIGRVTRVVAIATRTTTTARPSAGTTTTFLTARLREAVPVRSKSSDLRGVKERGSSGVTVSSTRSLLRARAGTRLMPGARPAAPARHARA